MTETLLLAPHREPGGAGRAATTVAPADRGADPVIPFPKDSDNFAVMLQPGDALRELVRLAAEVFPPNVRVLADLPAQLWLIRGDPGEIDRALVDVLLNACAAMAGGGFLSISARNVAVSEAPDTPFFEASAGDYVEVVLADTGADIDQEAEGLSIGPDFVRMARVLRNHGGFARIEARSGQGTTVSLYFPRAAPASDLIDAVDRPAMPMAGTILVVDADEAILGLCHLILSRVGYEVLIACDGGEALALFARRRADIGLVLTDLSLPGMNGLTLAWTLRRSKPGLQVMAVAGPGIGDNLDELENTGVQRVLFKPYTPQLLLDAVTRAFAEPVQCEPGLFLQEKWQPRVPNFKN